MLAQRACCERYHLEEVMLVNVMLEAYALSALPYTEEIGAIQEVKHNARHQFVVI